jgi:hypothetical protein
MDATCATCLYWVPSEEVQDSKGTNVLGDCHAGIGGDIDVRREATWWCSEHPLRQRDRLAEKMLVALITLGRAAYPLDVAKEAYELADGMIEVRHQQLEGRSKGSK